jgi:hypothetical protein
MKSQSLAERLYELFVEMSALRLRLKPTVSYSPNTTKTERGAK